MTGEQHEALDGGDLDERERKAPSREIGARRFPRR
jgi:hypothetical protein